MILLLLLKYEYILSLLLICPKKQAASCSNFYVFSIVSYLKKEHNNLGFFLSSLPHLKGFFQLCLQVSNFPSVH